MLFIKFFLLFSSFSMLMSTLHSFSSLQVNISFLCHSSVSCKISYYESLKLTDHMITLFRALIFINACHLRNSIFWYCPTLQNCNSFVFYIFFFFFFYKFIYLFLVMLGLHCCMRAFSSCGEWGPPFVAVHGPLIAVASRVAEHGL